MVEARTGTVISYEQLEEARMLRLPSHVAREGLRQLLIDEANSIRYVDTEYGRNKERMLIAAAGVLDSDKVDPLLPDALPRVWHYASFLGVPVEWRTSRMQQGYDYIMQARGDMVLSAAPQPVSEEYRRLALQQEIEDQFYLSCLDRLVARYETFPSPEQVTEVIQEVQQELGRKRD